MARRYYPSREERIARYKARVQDAIVSCPNCQPWEGGPVWIKGHQMDLREVLDDCGVPEDEAIRDEVVSGLVCPGCGDSVDSWGEVGIRHDFEVEHETAIDLAERRYGPKLYSFAAFLEQYPMLGAAHPIGRRLLKEIRTFPHTSLEKSTWFRARRIQSGRQFTPDDLRIPDADSVLSPGRYNHLGQAHWYLASSEYTAVREVVDRSEKIAWLQKWIVSPIEPILDLVKFGPDDLERVTDAKVQDLPMLATAMIFGGHLNRPVDHERGWQPEYFIPHYVADAAKHVGFKGVRFTSTRGFDVNLVIFSKDAPVEPDGTPVLYNLGDAFRDVPF